MNRKICLPKVISIVILVAILILPLTLVACAAEEIKEEEVRPTAQLVIQPPIIKSGDKPIFIGSGFTPGEKIDIFMSAAGVDIKLNAALEPVLSEPNEFGAFAGTLWGTGTVGKPAPGVYAIKAVNAKGEVLATAPLQVT